MPRHCCHDKIKVLEDNLILLKNLLVKEDLLIEGNLLVKGNIINQNGSSPTRSYLCSNGVNNGSNTDVVFDINRVDACRIIVQGPFASNAGRVIYGPQTPNGLYYIINAAPVPLFVSDITNNFPVITLDPPADPNNPTIRRLLFVEGIILQNTELGPIIIGEHGANVCILGSTTTSDTASIENPETSRCANDDPFGGGIIFLVRQLDTTLFPSYIIYGPNTTGTLRANNYSKTQPLIVIDIRAPDDTGRQVVIPPFSEGTIVFTIGFFTQVNILPF